ncbi:MAG: hypothetical protein FWC50_12160 [Planctomycetaceae bacterium]|nr:hypothetical protein [Planctomycetaceae bacterium]
MNQRLFILFLCIAGLFVAGCGGEKKPDGMPTLHKATLTFTQGGTPLADATITLTPQDAANVRWPAGGTTDSQGVLHVKTMAQYDGAPAGKYKIIVSKTETEGAAAPTESSDAAGARPAVSTQKMYNLIEKDYRFADTTPLTVEIKAGKNEETLEAGKAVRELIPVYTN